MSRVERAWGSNDMETLFPDGAPITPTPWPAAGRRKSRGDYDHAAVDEAVQARNLTSVDPRELHATQSSLTRAGVSHYMQGTGENYKDGWKAGNRDPVVYNRNGTRMILSGHHRAATALLQGRQFDAVEVHGDWGPER